MKDLSPEKLHALGTIFASIAIILAVAFILSGGTSSPLFGPDSEQDSPKPWVMELP